MTDIFEPISREDKIKCPLCPWGWLEETEQKDIYVCSTCWQEFKKKTVKES